MHAGFPSPQPVPSGGGHIMLRDEVAASWTRCIERYNLAPDRAPRVDLLTHHELQQNLDARADILSAAGPEIDRLFHRLVDNDYMVSLASSDGVKLLYRCAQGFMAEMSQLGVLPGSVWHEALRGTNGIGTCLMLGRSLSIRGQEHFRDDCKTMSCTVAPVFGADGAIEGVVNVTSPRVVDDRTVRIVHDIVRRAALRIENRHFATRNGARRMVRLSADDDFGDIALEGRLALDDRDRVIDVSSLICDLMRRSRADLLGRRIDEVLGLEMPSDPGRIVRSDRGLVAAWHAPQRSVGRQPSPRGERMGGSRQRPIEHPDFIRALDVGRKLAAAGVPVIIEGETGTGKTMLARGLQDSIPGGDLPVCVMDCAALGDDADALDRLRGMSDAVVVLDHLDEMTPSAQARLVQHLSDDDLMACRGIHLIAMACTGLADLVGQGRLRADLLHRLQGRTLTLAPLRMAADREAIIDAAFQAEAVVQGKAGWPLDTTARLILGAYHWPGNLRELRMAARTAVILAGDGVISVNDLPRSIVDAVGHHDITARSRSEASRIEAALKHNGGNVSRTARYLGMSRATLYRKIEVGSLRDG